MKMSANQPKRRVGKEQDENDRVELEREEKKPETVLKSFTR